MSSSCGELGLRIALCDLIERLKRCEQKCSYLEECRHELIKEVMRLRLENEWLANACRNNTLMSDSNQLALNSSPFVNCYNNSNNNIIIRSFNDLKPENRSIDKNSEFNTNGSDSEIRDESWQQITARLLQDLKRDIANGSNGYTLDRQKLNPIDTLTTNENLIEAIVSEEQQLINRNNETIITINDSLSQSEDTLMDDKNYFQLKRQKHKKVLNPMENTSFPDFNNSTYSLVSNEIRIKDKIFNNPMENDSEEKNPELKRSPNHLVLFESNPIDGNIEYINAFSTAMSYLKRDLNEVFQALSAQNEKLNKLKAKQLRNYFKRQINFDQNFHQTSTPLKIDPKFNNENY